MGRKITRYFLGAYFKVDMPNNEFQQVLNELNFHNDFEDDLLPNPKYEHFYYERFVSAYQSLKFMPILLPYEKPDSKPFAIELDDYDEELELDFEKLDFKESIENLEETYADEIKDMQDIFGDKLKIKTGLVAYFDETA